MKCEQLENISKKREKGEVYHARHSFEPSRLAIQLPRLGSVLLLLLATLIDPLTNESSRGDRDPARATHPPLSLKKSLVLHKVSLLRPNHKSRTAHPRVSHALGSREAIVLHHVSTNQRSCPPCCWRRILHNIEKQLLGFRKKGLCFSLSLSLLPKPAMQ